MQSDKGHSFYKENISPKGIKSVPKGKNKDKSNVLKDIESSTNEEVNISTMVEYDLNKVLAISKNEGQKSGKCSDNKSFVAGINKARRFQQNLKSKDDIQAEVQILPEDDIQAEEKSAPGGDIQAEEKNAPGYDIQAEEQNAPGDDIQAEEQNAPGDDIQAEEQNAPGDDIQAEGENAPGDNIQAEEQRPNMNEFDRRLCRALFTIMGVVDEYCERENINLFTD